MYPPSTKPLPSSRSSRSRDAAGSAGSLREELERVARSHAARHRDKAKTIQFVDVPEEVPWDPRADVVALKESPLPAEIVSLLARGARAVFDAARPRSVIVRHVSSMLRRDRTAPPRIEDMRTNSPVMGRVLRSARRLVRSDASVLITGDTGVGKEHLARAIHASGPRADRPFRVVNCGALPENLLESQLFGHERGAFTGAEKRHEGFFEAADGGTLLLDEIGEMPAHLQVKLLTALESREVVRVGSSKPVPVDVRVIAATNRRVDEEVTKGTFRSDLFYRLDVVRLELPRLADRREDLPSLVGYFLHELTTARGSEFHGIDAGALDALLGYAWPGNVRELHNVLEHAVLMADGAKIECHHLPASLHTTRPDRKGESADADEALREGGLWFDVDAWQGRTLRDVRDAAVAAVERAFLVQLLERTSGRIAETAELAGLRPRSLYDKMRQLDLRKEDFRPGR